MALTLKTAVPALLLYCAAASAQTGTDRRKMLLDSLLNPEVSETGAMMRFETRTVDAGTVAEESAPAEYEFRWSNAFQRAVNVVQGAAQLAGDLLQHLSQFTFFLVVFYGHKAPPGF